MTPVSLLPSTRLTFRARGDGKAHRVMLFAKRLGFQIAEKSFVAGPDWKEYSFSFADFGVDGSDTMAVLFTGGPEVGPFAFEIDDVAFAK
jgi:hypothetical protein